MNTRKSLAGSKAANAQTPMEAQYDAFAELTEQAGHAGADQLAHNQPETPPSPVGTEVVRRDRLVVSAPGHRPTHETLVSPAGLYAGVSATARNRCGVVPVLLDTVALDLLIDDLPQMLNEIRAMCEQVPDATGPPGEPHGMECRRGVLVSRSRSERPGTDAKAIDAGRGEGVPG